MPSNLPERVPKSAQRDAPRRTTVVYAYSTSVRVGGIAGVLLGALFLAALVALLVLGAVVITLVLWVALGAAVIAVGVALLRGVFAGGGMRRHD